MLDVPWFGEDLVEDKPDHLVVPIELSYELQHLIDRLLGKDIVNEMPDKQLHRRSFLLLPCCPFGWVALYHALGPLQFALSRVHLDILGNTRSLATAGGADRDVACFAFAS